MQLSPNQEAAEDIPESMRPLEEQLQEEAERQERRTHRPIDEEPPAATRDPAEPVGIAGHEAPHIPPEDEQEFSADAAEAGRELAERELWREGQLHRES